MDATKTLSDVVKASHVADCKFFLGALKKARDEEKAAAHRKAYRAKLLKRLER